MKTKLDRVPISLSELVSEQAAKEGMPKTMVYKNIEIAMRNVGIKQQKKKDDKPLFRF